MIDEKLAEYDELRENNAEMEGMLNSALVHIFNPLEVNTRPVIIMKGREGEKIGEERVDLYLIAALKISFLIYHKSLFALPPFLFLPFKFPK